MYIASDNQVYHPMSKPYKFKIAVCGTESHTVANIPSPLSIMYAVYVQEEGQNWQLFSAEPNLECAKTTASMLEVTQPDSNCRIVPPKKRDDA